MLAFYLCAFLYNNIVPNVLIYNPTCEMAIRLNTATYQPPKHLAKFESDLASLMMFIADVNDYVVATRPDEEFLQTWAKCGIHIPNFCTPNNIKLLLDNNLKLKPWGQCKSIFHQYGDIKNMSRFNEEMRIFLSRQTSAIVEEKLSTMNLPQYAQSDFIPQIINDFGKAEILIKQSTCVLKSLWSSSGRGVLILDTKEHVSNALIWAKDKIDHDGGFIFEPLLKRKCEFSLLFKITENNEIIYLGKNYFAADNAGRFGNELIGFDEMNSFSFPTNWETEISTILTETIKQLDFASKYKGYIGFDAMAYADSKGKIKIRPCMEINLRTCMGNINLEISKCFAKGVKAQWHIEHFAANGQWDEFCTKEESRHALQFNADGLINQGFFRLSPRGNDIRFAAWGKVVEN